MSDCGHVFYLVAPDGKRGDEALILQHLEILGVTGFALHYAVERAEFRVSHVASGALASPHSPHHTAADAITDAWGTMEKSCVKRGVSAEANMEYMIEKVRAVRLAAGWPMEDK